MKAPVSVSARQALRGLLKVLAPAGSFCAFICGNPQCQSWPVLAWPSAQAPAPCKPLLLQDFYFFPLSTNPQQRYYFHSEQTCSELAGDSSQDSKERGRKCSIFIPAVSPNLQLPPGSNGVSAKEFTQRQKSHLSWEKFIQDGGFT